MPILASALMGALSTPVRHARGLCRPIHPTMDASPKTSVVLIAVRSGSMSALGVQCLPPAVVVMLARLRRVEAMT
jgi:hypothetical protein